MNHVEIMVNELERVDGVVRELWIGTEKIIGIGTGLLGAGLVFMSRSQHPDLAVAFFVLPFALGGVYAYALNILREMMAQAAWKSVLERRLEIGVPGLRLQWDSEIAPKVVVFSVSQAVMFGYFLLLYLAALIGGYVALWRVTDSGWGRLGGSAGLAVIGFALTLSALDAGVLAAPNVVCAAEGRRTFSLLQLRQRSVRAALRDRSRLPERPQRTISLGGALAREDAPECELEPVPNEQDV